MFLVAGLAVAGLVGIAAAFYFSIRSGNRGDKRLRSARAGRAVTDRRPGSRSGTARPDLAGHPRRAASGGGRPPRSPCASLARGIPAPRPTPGPIPSSTSTRCSPAAAVPLRPWPRRDRAGRHRRRTCGRATPRPADSWPDDSWPGDSWPDDPAPEDPATSPTPSWARATSRPGRPSRAGRVGFRKGADLDEELWPTETFGGVSDEQFWDDLASDKPLATRAHCPAGLAGQEPAAVGAPVTGLEHRAGRRPAGRPGPGGRPGNGTTGSRQGQAGGSAPALSRRRPRPGPTRRPNAPRSSPPTRPRSRSRA